MGGKGSGRRRVPGGKTDTMAERRRVKMEALAMRAEFHDLPAPDLTDAGAIRDRCALFFDSCERRALVPTLGGLAMALRIPTFFVQAVREGERPKWRGVRFTEESARELVANMLEVEQVWQTTFENDGYANPVAPIYASKNMYGWKDTQETHVVSVSARTSLAELQAKYQGAIASHASSDREHRAIREAASARRATNRAVVLESAIEAGQLAPPEDGGRDDEGSN